MSKQEIDQILAEAEVADFDYSFDTEPDMDIFIPIIEQEILGA